LCLQKCGLLITISISSFATFNWILIREKLIFFYGKEREKNGNAFAQSEGMFEKRKEKLWRCAELKIRQRMTQASFSLHSRKMHEMCRVGNSGIPVTGWSVNKKCALGHCAPCTEKFNDATVSFSILFLAANLG